MKSNKESVNEVREKIAELLGKSVKLKTNRGRNKILTYDGVITEQYENIFVVSVKDKVVSRVCCSYFDVMCGEVSVKVAKQ